VHLISKKIHAQPEGGFVCIPNDITMKGGFIMAQEWNFADGYWVPDIRDHFLRPIQ
jgi:hypothetical protein